MEGDAEFIFYIFFLSYKVFFPCIMLMINLDVAFKLFIKISSCSKFVIKGCSVMLSCLFMEVIKVH